MAPRAKTDVQLQAQTTVMHVLLAIKPKLGSLQDLGDQNALLKEVIQKHSLERNVDQLRKCLTGAVTNHCLSPAVKPADVFKKKAIEVFDSGYIAEINAMIRADCKEKPGKVIQKPPTLKLKQSLKSVAAETHDAKQMPQAGGSGLAVAAGMADAPAKQNDSPNHRSALSTSNPQEVKNATNQSEGHAANVNDDLGNPVNPVTTGLGDTQESSTENQQPTEDAEKDNRTAKASPIHSVNENPSVQAMQGEQRVENFAKGSQVQDKQREELRAAHLANRSLETELKSKEEEIQTLKKQLQETDQQRQTSPSKKRALETEHSRGESSVQPAAKRSKFDTEELQYDSRAKVERVMEDLCNDARNLAFQYVNERGVKVTQPAEVIVNPSEELEELYAIIFRSVNEKSWEETHLILQQQAHEIFRCLIGAGIFHLVFSRKKPLSEGATGDQTFAGLARHLLKEDDLVREAAHRRIEDKEFQNGEIAEYAKQLAQKLSITLSPHLVRMTAGKRGKTCTKWIDSLTNIFRAALIVKARADIFLEGTLEPFWSLIGSRMIPGMSNIPTNDKHLPHEIYFVRWPGLKMNVEGEQKEVIVSMEEAVTRLIKTPESGA